MKPTVVRMDGLDERFILIEFVATADDIYGIIVDSHGRLTEASLDTLQVEAPNPDFPMGFGPFSRVESERG